MSDKVSITHIYRWSNIRYKRSPRRLCNGRPRKSSLYLSRFNITKCQYLYVIITKANNLQNSKQLFNRILHRCVETTFDNNLDSLFYLFILNNLQLGV